MMSFYGDCISSQVNFQSSNLLPFKPNLGYSENNIGLKDEGREGWFEAG